MTKKDPLKTQSVLLSKSRFSTLKKAEKWIEKHDFKKSFRGKKGDSTENYWRFRQADPGRFKKDAYVTKEIDEGIMLVLANKK